MHSLHNTEVIEKIECLLPVSVTHSSCRYLASGSEDGTVVVWDLAGGRVMTEISSSSQVNSGNTASGTPHQDSIMNVCWSTDSSLLVSASSDGCVRTSHLKQTPAR